MTLAYSQKASSHKTRAGELNIQNESLVTEIQFLRTKHEELAQRCGELEEQRRADDKQRQRLESAKNSLERQLREKETALQDAQLDWKREKANLDVRANALIADKDSVSPPSTLYTVNNLRCS